MRPLKAPMVEHENLPTQRANHFDPNAYRLLVKAGYKQEDVAKLVQEPSEPTNVAAKANKVWLKKTDSARSTKPGLGFPPLKLKINREASRHITAEEVNEEEEIQVESPRPSVFSRLGARSIQTSDDEKEEVLDQPLKSSVFSRLGVSASQTSSDEDKENQDLPPKPSILNRLGAAASRTSAFDRLSVARKRASVFDRLKSDEVEASSEKPIHIREDKKSNKASQKKRQRGFIIDEYKEIHSTVPSRMKRQSKWVVTTGETLKGMKHTVVTTRQAFEDEGNEEREIFSSNHVSVEEVEEDEEVPQLEDAQEAPASFEEGNQGTIDELKQVNLGTEQDPRLIFISACLTLEEEKSYLDLLKEYRDVFTWSNKEMP